MVVGFSYSYITKIKDAKQDIQSLHSELSSLVVVLSILKHQVDSNKTAAKHLLALEGPLKECRRVLEDIQGRLEPRKGSSRRILHRARWPLLQSHTSAVLLTIERYKSLFGLAMSAEQQ